MSKAADPVAEMIWQARQAVADLSQLQVSGTDKEAELLELVRKLDEFRHMGPRRLGASGVQGPRCPNPNCGSDKLWIFWHENRIGCDSCRSSYYCLHMADFVQFFPAGASGVEQKEGENGRE